MAEPGDVLGVLAALASAWGMPAHEVQQMVYANFARALKDPRGTAPVHPE
jgi:Tat protein secretion system quality control protein TatD with DNase activity